MVADTWPEAASIRLTVPSPEFDVQTDPAPKATATASFPTPTNFVTWFDVGSTRMTRCSSLATTQPAPPPTVTENGVLGTSNRVSWNWPDPPSLTTVVSTGRRARVSSVEFGPSALVSVEPSDELALPPPPPFPP